MLRPTGSSILRSASTRTSSSQRFVALHNFIATDKTFITMDKPLVLWTKLLLSWTKLFADKSIFDTFLGSKSIKSAGCCAKCHRGFQ